MPVQLSYISETTINLNLCVGWVLNSDVGTKIEQLVKAVGCAGLYLGPSRWKKLSANAIHTLRYFLSKIFETTDNCHSTLKLYIVLCWTIT